ncbi:MAG TPA: undecaprenyldiphospho-muramoylpentapeptide beta-N-acetylglucosaminyltransferase [Candidatus Binatia bacterium]|nr:undecaprenyldiphospho-muramoylpentapeptide beta-N-acetylglucosaminyltransferase [Candidatus Binatia bacterium]
MIIAGGGTGGHLFPGIAVARELARRGASVSFVGSDYGIERTAVPRAGFEVDLLSIRGVRGEGWAGVARAFRRVPASVAAALRLLRRRDPGLVIGVGGYASFPAVAAAALRRVPIVLLEQNAAPGLATRLLAPLAARVCVSFPATARVLGRRALVTGNPVRTSGVAGSRRERAAGEPFRVLVFGGSAGAHRLNEVVPTALAQVGRPLAVTHQTGPRDRDTVEEAYRALGVAARTVAFIDDMESAYAEADLVVCRAGATTIAELTALGLPAILVPFPYAAGDHQRLNAEALVEAGAAWMLADRELSPDAVSALVRRAIDDPAALAAMAERARGLGRPDAAARVADECFRLVGATAAGASA